MVLNRLIFLYYFHKSSNLIVLWVLNLSSRQHFDLFDLLPLLMDKALLFLLFLIILH